MKLNSLDFTNLNEFKDYINYIYPDKKQKNSIPRNIEKELNSCILTLTIEELSPIEYLILEESATEVLVDQVVFGNNHCNLKKIEISDEYEIALKNASVTLGNIERETGETLFHSYIPFTLIEFKVRVIFSGYQIIQFFGSDLINIFDDEEDIDKKIFKLFYQYTYQSFLLKTNYNTLNKKNYGEDYTTEKFMNDYHYNKIMDNEIFKLECIQGIEGLSFHFIDGKDDMNTFITKLNSLKDDFHQVNIVFLCNTTIINFIINYYKMKKYLLDHEELNSLIIKSNYRMSARFSDYEQRIKQIIGELHSERDYQIRREGNTPINSSFYMIGNTPIKYRLSIPLDEFLTNNPIDDIFNKGSSGSDIFDEQKTIKETSDNVLKILKNVIK